jgi:pimeloyl-ACP methyl ester carboxylesterase
MTIAFKSAAQTSRLARYLGALLCITAFASPIGKASAQTAFYDASEREIAGTPGTLIRSEPMGFAPAGAQAYRVLYRSTDIEGQPIAVSGVIVMPPGPAPAGGRPIVAWAHPTTGVVPHCAPSLAIFVFQQMAGLRQLIEQGAIVAATDYPGLGTPGPHPYLVGDSEARAVIDSVRVARNIPGADGGNSFAVWGHSQGGQASLYTGLIAKTYAPELNLVGVAAAAPATSLVTLMGDDFKTSGGKNLTAMTLWSWARVYHAPIDKVVLSEAIPTVDRLADECIESIFDIIARRRTEKPLEEHFLSVPNIATVEPWRSLAIRNTPGALSPQIPVFLAQGTTDDIVRPDVTRAYMEEQCKVGGAVSMMWVQGVGHGFIAADSADRAVNWMMDRFAGRPAPSDCGKTVATGFGAAPAQ